jgi:hypothetical protein
MELESTFVCAHCFSSNDITIDTEGGPVQRYTEDCQTCCRPNALTVRVTDDFHSAHVEALPE